MVGPTGIWSAAEAKPEHYPKSNKLAVNLCLVLDESKYIIDFGCGDAFYLWYMSSMGFKHLVGIDGFKSVDEKNIFEADLSQSQNFPFRGQVLSLEVGEHIPQQYEQTFIDNLVRHCDSRLILSWAVPKQPGIGHVNCQPNQYIIEQVEKRGLIYNVHTTNFLRHNIERAVSYFSNTLMVFDLKK